MIVVPHPQEEPRNRSYVVLPASQVANMCRATIGKAERARDKRLSEIADEEVRCSERSWWRRLFRLPIMTHQEALDLPNEGMFDVRLDVEVDFRLHTMAANKLLNAATTSEHVHVTVDDLSSISWGTR
jgi:hypothetical protein